MILFLNTAAFEEVHFGLILPKNGKMPAKVLSEKKQRISHPETEKVLEYLDKFLRAAKVRPAQLTAIYVVSGPGSFTGIRAGIAHALAFSQALNIPIFALTSEQLPKDLKKLPELKLKKISGSFEPDYGREPNITMS